ncbi:DoxX family protein [Marinoscillum sp.]|uniref:DoxX family protein n=1 Tax=Marinoscillum sp. TaxID=2024838 RepID=UPI003BA953A3
MSKRNKIIYWIVTLWMSLGMVSTGIVQLIRLEEEVERTVAHLGYPVYLLSILGVWKILGVIVALVPGLPLLKEWAYAGFFFAMTGALASHLIVQDPFSEIFPSVLLLMLTCLSWYYRPASRRLVFAKSS